MVLGRAREKVVDDEVVPFEELERVLQLTLVLVEERESYSVY